MKWFIKNKVIQIVFLIAATTIICLQATKLNVYSENDIVESKGSMLNFYASFPESGIEWGKAPFDNKDGNGMDSSSDNRIVRTFDSATYNLNITANPTIEGSVNNVVIRVWGELDGAIADDDRVNATFSDRKSGEVFTVLHPEEDKRSDKKIAGIDFKYTLDRVGEAVSLPIDVAVQGAHDGTVIKPQIQIQVVEVDGKDITSEDLRVDLRDQLPSFEVTAQVSFQAKLGSVTGGGLQQTTAKGALDDPTDLGWYRPVSTEFALTNLPERSSGDMRGATFPSGKIDFEYEIYGIVDWWGKEKSEVREPMVFSENEDIAEIVHYHPITGEGRPTFKNGAKGLRWEDKTFRAINFGNWATGQSKMPDFKQSTIEQRYTHSVWDSGDWNIEPAKIKVLSNDWNDEKWPSQEAVTHKASVDNYVIGYTFPTRRANGNSGWLLPASDRTVYDGLNADKGTNGGLSGGKGVPAFATNVQLLYMPNIYRLGTKQNPEERGNEELHRYRIHILSYEDKDGKKVKYDKPSVNTVNSTLDNRGGGTIAVNQNIRGSAMKEENGVLTRPSTFKIGNEHAGDSTVVTGDSQLIQGNNIYVNGYLRTTRPSRGGVDHVYRWNTDTFKVTALIADMLEKEDLIRGYEGIDGFPVTGEGAKDTLSTLWGVQKFTDNHFESFMGRGKEDYEWFDDYAEAIKAGDVGARMIRVTGGVGEGTTTRSVLMPLFVHDQTLGSVNSKGTPNIVSSQGYVYFSGRDREPARSNYSYQSKGNYDWTNGSRNFTTYTSDYQIEKLQTPVGQNIPFATLAIVPGSASGTITSERSSMYSNEKVKWISNSMLNLPEAYDDKNGASIDPYMTVEHTLPSGLRYVAGSGISNDRNLNPTVKINDDQTQTLSWRVRMNEDRAANVNFETSVNPFGLDKGSSQRLVIQQDVSHELDKDSDYRRVSLRRSTDGVNVLRIGLVGVHGELNPTNGGIEESWKYTLRPYTTMKDEHGVRGTWTLPYNGDDYGSSFSGTIALERITVKGREDVKVWVNKKSVYIERPDELELSEDWEEWNNQEDIKTVYYEVEDILSAEDQLELEFTLSAENNKVGDRYIHQGNINSSTSYRVSPVTERERFEITPDASLGLEMIGINTQKAKDGLTAEVQFSTMVNRDRIRTEKFGIELHEINDNYESIKRVASWETTFDELSGNLDSIELEIDSNELESNTNKLYEARILTYGNIQMQIFEDQDKISTKGYTASEEDVILDIRQSESKEKPLKHKAVIRTERYVGQDIKTYFEEWSLYPEAIYKTKSGYGVDWKHSLSYKNDLGNDIEEITSTLKINEQIADGNYELVNTIDPATKEEGTFKNIPLQQAEDTEELAQREVETPDGVQSFILPEVYVEDGSGEIYTENDRHNGRDSLEASGQGERLMKGGRRLYVPIWPENLGDFDMVWETEPDIGVNSIKFQLWNTLEVFAYMYGHIDSETINDDEILLNPIDMKNPIIPDNFSNEDISWIKKGLIQ